MAATPFKTGVDIIITLVDDKGKPTGQTAEGIFECYGPMSDECSVLVERENDPSRNRRIFGVKLVNIELAPPPPPAPEGVPQG
jgi:hypothetical protein